uniref:Protein-PII uridylyltransferase N-terminal domain-containing protein n=1 Tax=Branchiostoma floridae TaxID=7739 RepID=C3ZJ57_BRAFL|eukprot:XP_002591377.1 hypothetical protein BRAFLDRAFT_86884 [Branchiostoma floridae]
MADVSITSTADKLQKLELSLKSQHGQEVGHGRALREAILSNDLSMEVEVLKSLGDLQLQKAKLSKDSAEFDKAAALYAAALLRCTDPDVGETLEHRIGYMEKLSRQLMKEYNPRFRLLSPDYWGTADRNVFRVAEICDKLDRSGINTLEQNFTKTLVTAIENSDMFLELEVLKSLGDFYLEKGRKTSDASQFSKAAAMYNKALTRCGHPETKLTLEHRIRYMQKVRDAVQMQISWSEEKHFAAALKTVHAADPTAQQYQREVEPLCKLGEVYSKRGQQTGDGGDFVKAAALYNAAIARSEDQICNSNLERAIQDVEKTFIKCIFKLGIHSNVSQDDTEKHKKQLKEMRDQIKLEMETIDQQLDPYVHDEDNPCVKEIEAKRAQAVRQLFENIAQQRKEFISLLVEECIGLMGPPPCKYALIGLGSQATGLVTPYSDLEFAILVEEESEECLVYFRNLTHYLHLKVVNLGETILPALGIKSLNDFYSKDPLDNWYYDSVTPRGFAFDGSMPKASKTPLGRQGTMDEPPSELICTPENMVSKLQNDVTLYLKEGYHLATILRNPCLIAGDQDLIHTYMDITVKLMQADGGEMTQQLAQEILKEQRESHHEEETNDFMARLFDVKKDIYRFPALAVDCMALSSGIIPTTVWKTIEEMENQQLISPSNAHHLTVLTSISAELRLRTYIANGGQKENLSGLTSMEVETNLLKPVFYLPYKKQLFRYYYTALPLKSILSEWPGNKTKLNLFSYLYDNSPCVQGVLYNEFCKYKLAISYYNEALKETGQSDHVKLNLFSRLGLVWYIVGNFHKAINYTEQALQMCRCIYGPTTAHPDIARSLSNLAKVWSGQGDYRKGIRYCEQALQMYRSIYGKSTEHAKIAVTLSHMAQAWHKLSDHRKAISYYEQALQMYRSIYGQSTAHPLIATSLNNMGLVLCDLGDYRKAISFYEQALQMERSVYGQGTAQPFIASTLNNLGAAWLHLGEHRKAISYHQQALQMCRSIYGTTHPAIATSLSNLGSAWTDLGHYKKAISYYEQGLQTRRSIYGQTTAHPDLANSLINIGTAWRNLGDYRKAINFYEQALQMNRSIYGQGTAHLHIASSLNNLGSAWSDLGDYRKAISYHEQALQLKRIIYGQSTVHADIANSLNNLGVAWLKVSDHRKSVSYLEQALQMFKSIYGLTAPHPDIATLSTNLGEVWHQLGDYSKAISYHEQALQMCRSIYGQSTAHPLIASSLNKLGKTWCSLGDYRKAISYHDQAQKMQKSIYGQSTAHADIATSLNNLGVACYFLGDHRKAISCHEEALQMQRCIHVPISKDHWEGVILISHPAGVYSHLKCICIIQ